MKSPALIFSTMITLAGGCVVAGPGILDAGGHGDTGGSDEALPEGESATDEGETDEGEPVPHDGDGCTEALDILLVVDDSRSMGYFQRHVTDAFPLLIEGLDQRGVDWRLAVTTTDGGGPWCENAMAEHGAFVFSACTGRLDDFMSPAGLEVQDIACNEICGLAPGELVALPTFTKLDGATQPRPWLQREAGKLNIPADIEIAEAIHCMLPQGINGCGFEQPLESMRRALARTTQPLLPEAGFLRDNASLLVLLVTDEADCSPRPEYQQAIFSFEGNKVFWSDPEFGAPTSAICWNAGVDCFGDPPKYDDCVPADKNVFGDPAAEPMDAVLYPVARYQSVLSAIEQSKRAKDPGLDVMLLAVTGVELDGTITYADVGQSDPFWQVEFGIGPGCTKPASAPIYEITSAVPPVRIRDVARHMTSDPLWSICAETFDEFMLATLERLVGGC